MRFWENFFLCITGLLLFEHRPFMTEPCKETPTGSFFVLFCFGLVLVTLFYSINRNLISLSPPVEKKRKQIPTFANFKNICFILSQLVFVNCLLCARHCFKQWEYKEKQKMSLPSRSSQSSGADSKWTNICKDTIYRINRK